MNPTQHYSQELKQKIYIMKPTVSKNSRGTTVYTYPEDVTTVDTNVVPTRASIEPFGQMIIKGMALQVDTILTRIVIRYRKDIGSKDRIWYNCKIYEQAVPPMDINMEHKFLQLTCKEMIKNG